MGQDQSAQPQATGVTERLPPKAKAKINDIIVVSKVANKSEKTDEDLENLKSIKLSKPILQNSLGDVEYANIPTISSGPLSEMVLRYQFHLTECAEAVSFDQNVLSKRIKDLDTLAVNVYKNLNERHKFVDSVITQVMKVSEVTVLLERIDVNLKNTKVQIKLLNELLSEDERIHDTALE